MNPLRALAEPRHSCHACGACCHGVRVRLLSTQEEQRIRALAAELGVEEPVEEGRLRFVDGHCVLLGENNLCMVHARYGSAAKPFLCQQYPAVIVDTEAETRIGIDPGCFTLYQSWNTGEPLAEDAPIARNAAARDPEQAGAERAFLAMSGRRDASIAGLLALMGDHEPAEGLPDGLASRWIVRLQASQIGRLLARPETGAPVRDALMPIARAAERWCADSPPTWPALDEEQEAFAIEVVRRLVFLRLVATLPIIQGVATLALLGAVAAGWTNPDRHAFGKAMVAWNRALRAPIFWSSILPGPEALRQLMFGARGARGLRE